MAVYSSGHRGGANQAMVAAVGEISDGKAEGAVVNLHEGGVAMETSVPPPPGSYLYPPS